MRLLTYIHIHSIGGYLLFLLFILFILEPPTEVSRFSSASRNAKGETVEDDQEWFWSLWFSRQGGGLRPETPDQEPDPL